MLVSPAANFQHLGRPQAGSQESAAVHSLFTRKIPAAMQLSVYKQLVTDGLWHNNPGLIQFLGICPLLAVSNSLVNGLGLGIATTVVLILSNLSVSLLKPWIHPDVRLPAYVLIIASLVTVIELTTQAWFYDLWLSLGIFLPLIVTNCVILARAESFASRQPAIAALVDGAAHGLGFAIVLVALGAVRELIGTGGIFNHADQLFGPAAADMGLSFNAEGSGFLLALLPPGAFLGLALLLAAKNTLSHSRANLPQSTIEATPEGSTTT
jgi:electron transport complex protein RnfE